MVTQGVEVWLEKHLERKKNFACVIQSVFFLITIPIDKYDKQGYFS